MYWADPGQRVLQNPKKNLSGTSETKKVQKQYVMRNTGIMTGQTATLQQH